MAARGGAPSGGGHNPGQRVAPAGCWTSARKPRFGHMSRSSLVLEFVLLGAAGCAPDTASSRLIAPRNPSAITYGSVDASNTYANVGAFIVTRKSNGHISPICSGTLISPTVFLTAGHCTAYFT